MEQSCTAPAHYPRYKVLSEAPLHGAHVVRFGTLTGLLLSEHQQHRHKYHHGEDSSDLSQGGSDTRNRESGGVDRKRVLGYSHRQMDCHQCSGDCHYRETPSSIAFNQKNTDVNNTQVYVNKAIFSSPAFRQCQLGFVSFHFAITWITLQIASRPGVAGFTPARTSLIGILPLTIAMAANVVLMNLSLAYSSVIFYQIVRILLTPLTAMMNFFIYGSRIPVLATLALIPACAGVAVVSYLETVAQSASTRPSTSLLGMIFALSGVTVSALYTVWVSAYYRNLKMSSAQLLHNQMPIGGLMLAVSSYFMDKYPVWADVDRKHWVMIATVSLPVGAEDSQLTRSPERDVRHVDQCVPILYHHTCGPRQQHGCRSSENSAHHRLGLDCQA